MSLITLTLILFLIMDPVGHIKSFIAALVGISPERQKYIIRREMFVALAVMLFFDLVGDYIFQVLSISDKAVYLASGVILFLVAIKILFPKKDAEDLQPPSQEPFIVPLAIPMIAGPALLATIMLYAESETKIIPMLEAIVLAWLASSIILINSKKILALFGSSGISACEKLMGMVLVLLAVQRLTDGIMLLFKPG